MLSIEKIKLDLESKLSKYRFEHSVRVAEEAKKLAMYYGVNEENAYMAGILHDIAKEYDDEKNSYLINKYNLPTELLNNKKICHAMVGAIVAQELYDVSDEVAQAIKYHTIGNINMTMLDKIVFVADKIDSGKNYLGIEEERELAYKDIDEALLKCINNNREVLKQKGMSLHKDTEELLEFLKKRFVN